MTHRTVEGSPESGSRITPDAPASPAPPQGEREAFLQFREDFSSRMGMHPTAWDTWQEARASLSASVPVAQDEREATDDDIRRLAHEHGEGVTRYTNHSTVEFTFDGFRAALSAATPPAAVPMSQKTQDGHSASGDLLGSYDADAFLAARLRRLFAHFDYPLPSFAKDDARLIGIAGSCIGAILLRLETDAPSLRSAAGDQPSNGHGPESAGTQQAPDMRAVCEALGFDPTNHHNAAKCPYCRPAGTQQPAAKTDHIRRVPGGAAFLRVAGTQSDTERDAAPSAEMIEAGMLALCGEDAAQCDHNRQWGEDAARKVYAAMRAAMGNQSAGKESHD